MRPFTLLLSLSFLISACSGDKTNFKLEINVNGTGDEMIYLAKRSISGSTIVDSTMPEKSGKYILRGFTDQPEFYIVYLNPREYINLIIHPGDDFRILTDKATFDRNYIVEGSADSRLIQKMITMQVRTLENITQLTEQYESGRNNADFNSVRKEIDSKYDQVFNEHKNFSIDLIRQNPASLASLMCLYQQLGRNMPVFDYKKDLYYYELVDSNLSPLYPNSEAVIDLNHKVTELRELLKLEPGSPAPDLALPDSSGRIIKLSSQKGKYVVLLFWASWSSQSKSYLDRLEAVYNKFNRNIEFYQVSLDRTRKSWLNNISSKGIHVSDIMYWDSPVVKTYHIEKLPVIYLIDEKGLILEKGFNVDELPDILEKYQTTAKP